MLSQHSLPYQSVLHFYSEPLSVQMFYKLSARQKDMIGLEYMCTLHDDFFTMN